jgi:hypothetical protein
VVLMTVPSYDRFIEPLLRFVAKNPYFDDI